MKLQTLSFNSRGWTKSLGITTTFIVILKSNTISQYIFLYHKYSISEQKFFFFFVIKNDQTNLNQSI